MARRSFDDGLLSLGSALLAENDLGPWLRTVEPGRPACVFTDDVEDARNALEQLVTSEREPARVVALSWTEVPPLSSELGLLVDALARATFELYPSLYGVVLGAESRWEKADVETDAHAVTRRLPAVLGAACRQVLSACRIGEVPSLRRLSNAEQAHQLALAIEPHRLVVVIAVRHPRTNGTGLRALAHGAEWLASNTHSRVVLALPRELRGSAELDHVTHTTCLFTKPAETVA